MFYPVIGKKPTNFVESYQCYICNVIFLHFASDSMEISGNLSQVKVFGTVRQFCLKKTQLIHGNTVKTRKI